MTTKSYRPSTKIHGEQHEIAREDYLSRRGPAARRQRAAERAGVVLDDQPRMPKMELGPHGLPLWEEKILFADSTSN